MPYDAHKNFAVSSVVTSPSPATSGTSIVLATGEGARMPAVPFNATIAPASPTQALPSNSEIVRVTARPGAADTFTITRAQEGSTARSVVAGDRFFASITAKTLTDIEYGAGPYFNVRAYGAVGDGTTDDSGAIQAAINAAINTTFAGIGCTVFFPTGKYYVATGLTNTASGVTFMGEGISGIGSTISDGDTQILVGNGQWGLTVGTPGSTQFRGYRVEHLHFFEKNAGQAIGGLHLVNAADSYLEDLNFGSFTNSVATTFTGTPGAVSTLGTLTLASTTGWPTSGSGRIATSGSATLRAFTYTGVSGSTLTGCLYRGNTTDTVAASAVVTADVGVGLLQDSGPSGNAQYSTLMNCKFGDCMFGHINRNCNGTRTIACLYQGTNGPAPRAGSMGVLIETGDTFRSIGCVYQGYDTLQHFNKANNNHQVLGARWEVWGVVAVRLNGGDGTVSCEIHGNGDNSLLHPGGDTGIIIASDVVNAWVRATLSSTATTFVDNGIRSTIQIANPVTNTYTNYGPMAGGSLTSSQNYISADVTMTTAGTFYDGPTLTLGAGTWLLTGSIYLQAATTAVRQFNAKLWDGTTTISAATHYVEGTGQAANDTSAFSAIVAPSSSTTYKISANSSVNADIIRGTGTKASYLLAVKIA